MKTLLLSYAFLVRTLVSAKEDPELEAGKRVLGSQQASIGQFPYQVILQDPNKVFYCGGSIVAKNSILTAAQCDVEIGDIAIAGAQGFLNSLGVMIQTVQVIFTIARQDFNYPVPLANDIRVVKVVPGFDFSSPFVGPVNLPTIDYEDYAPNIDRALSGWSSSPYFTPLQYTINYVLDDAMCIGPSNGVFIPSMLCTQTLADACPLDLGGPLVDQLPGGTSSTGVTQIGILSFGYQCFNAPKPQNQLGYTQLSHHLSWINTYI